MIDWLIDDQRRSHECKFQCTFSRFFPFCCCNILSFLCLTSSQLILETAILSCTVTESPSCLRFLFHLRATLSSPPSRWSFFNREKYKSRRIQEQEARLMSLSSPESVEFTRQNRSTSKGSRRKETKIRRNIRHGFQFLFLSRIPLFFTRRW